MPRCVKVGILKNCQKWPNEHQRFEDVSIVAKHPHLKWWPESCTSTWWGWAPGDTDSAKSTLYTLLSSPVCGIGFTTAENKLEFQGLNTKKLGSCTCPNPCRWAGKCLLSVLLDALQIPSAPSTPNYTVTVLTNMYLTSRTSRKGIVHKRFSGFVLEGAETALIPTTG